KRQAPNLVYLEQVRQHLSRLPSIDPYTRTLILCGFPNVGKSSFLNKITRADVEVHSYAFTTKSLYVGHTDYKYLRWQVVDTPGVLDHPLEERNVIEMQAVTALAHLRAAILYFIDVSEQCGHSIAEQVKLYESIKPLFTNKPLLVVCNKVDVTPMDQLSEANREALSIFEKNNVPLLSMSAVTDEGVMEVKQQACDTLLAYRIENKIQAKKVDSILNRLHVALPKTRDEKVRPPCIPEMVLQKQRLAELQEFKKKLEKNLEDELGDDYILDLKKNYDLPDDIKYDVIPEFWNGRNIADFIHAELLQKVEDLEKEEALREEAGYYAVPKIEIDETLQEIKELAQKIRDRKIINRNESRISRQSSKPTTPRTAPARARGRSATDFRNRMEDLGVDMEGTDEAHFTKTRGRARSLTRSQSRTNVKKPRLGSMQRSVSTSRSQSRLPRNQSGVRDSSMQLKLKQVAHKAIAKKVKKQGLKGEADRFIGTKRPKHLQAPNLVYLEQVRQHLSRLPSIDPYTRTLILCGFPNVGKSSFLNKITRADVEVHSYAFTTKSLYVGHTDYKYLRWQVVDTPGVLDHPLEERNVIEMQAVTALAHLRAAILYFIDVSEQCGHSIAEQVKLYESIKPLFTNKPLLVVCNKVDVTPMDQLSEANREALSIFEKNNVPLLSMSAVTDEGVMEVKQQACDTLLAYRIENKIQAKKVDSILNRLHVALPKTRDEKVRPPCIPEMVLQKQRLAELQEFKKKLEKNLEDELGDDYILDLKKNYDLPDDIKYDVIPEFWNGRNIADFIHAELLQKVEDLEKEEALREEAGYYAVPKIEIDETLREIKELAQKIRDRKIINRNESRISRQSSKPTTPRTAPARARGRSATDFRNRMEDLGVDMEGTDEAHFTKTRGRARSLTRSQSRTNAKKPRLGSMQRSVSTSRSQSRLPRNQSGVRDSSMQLKLKQVAHKAIAKKVKKQGLKGEADRFIGTKRPKHLYAGKRGIGKTERR
ncbi:nucleolar GTP-binding protein 1, partial [Aphis craccivora]